MTLNLKAEEGIRQSIDHAEAVRPGWKNQALEMVRRFAELKPRFLCEEVRFFGEANGLPAPPDKRAWGAVIRSAAKDGMVSHDGFARMTDPEVHGALAVVWKSELFNQKQAA